MEKRRSRYGLTRIEKERKRLPRLGAKEDSEARSTGGVPSAAPWTNKNDEAGRKEILLMSYARRRTTIKEKGTTARAKAERKEQRSHASAATKLKFSDTEQNYWN